MHEALTTFAYGLLGVLGVMWLVLFGTALGILVWSVRELDVVGLIVSPILTIAILGWAVLLVWALRASSAFE